MDPWIINLLFSLFILAGSTWACVSKLIQDGILIKMGLAALAIGAAGDVLHPSVNAKLWMAVSVVAVLFFACVRIRLAALQKKQARFINVDAV